MIDKNEIYTFSWGGYGLPPDLKVAVGDVTGDGRPNIVVLNRQGFLVVYQWRKKYYYPTLSTHVGREFDEILLADINGDGVLEIVLGGRNSVIVYSYERYHFKILARKNLDRQLYSIAVGDLDGDYKAEIVISVGGSRIEVLSYENRRLDTVARMRTDSPSLVGAGDVNRDGVAELVLLQIESDFGSDMVLVYKLKRRDFILLASEELSLRASKFLKVLPVDDSHVDKIVITFNDDRRVLVLEYRSEHLRTQWKSSGFQTRIADIASGDWNGDGSPELFIAAGEFVYVYQWNGNRFIEIKRIDVNQAIDTIAAGDLDYDGRDEIVVGTLRGDLVIVRDKYKSKSQFLVSETITLPESYPDIIKVSEAKVTKVCIKEKKVIHNKVIVSGYFEVTVLYVAEPDRSVRAIDTKIHFVHVVQVAGIMPGSKVLVDIEVEYAEPRFNPAYPREIEVVVIAQVVAYDVALGHGKTLEEVAQEYGVNAEELAEVNDLEVGTLLSAGEKIKLPPQ